MTVSHDQKVSVCSTRISRLSAIGCRRLRFRYTRGTPHVENSRFGPSEQDALKLDLDALVREGARRMLLAALKAEVDDYVAEHADHRDEAGHALVVRNGVAEPRTVTTAAGELEIQAPRVHDRREGRRFTSAILPPWARRSPKVTEVLPVLYLRGISTKDFEPALAEFFGSEAGLSASTIQRLTREWSQRTEQRSSSVT